MNGARTAMGIVVLAIVVPLVVVALVNAGDWGVRPIVFLLAAGGAGAALVASARPAGADGTQAGGVGRVLGGATLGVGGVVLAALLLIVGVLAVIFLFQTMFSGIADAIGDSIGGS